MPGKIVVKGARTHNLKNIDLEIPRDQLVVITGVSGSGKSSLALDTLYAEGQRRYVESLSADARQYLQRLETPELDSVEGLSPAIAVQKKPGIFNARSTVGTVTEINDYLRILFAQIGRPACPQCGTEISARYVPQIVDELLELPSGSRVLVLAPLHSSVPGGYRDLLTKLTREGFARVKIGGRIHEISEAIELQPEDPARLELVIDRLVLREGTAKRLAESLEIASRMGQQFVTVEVSPDGEAQSSRVMTYSQKLVCTHCGFAFPEITPALFSFNSPAGGCRVCAGLGVIDNKSRQSKLPDRTGENAICLACAGTRLRPESLAVKIGGKSIADVMALPINHAIEFFAQLNLNRNESVIAQKILPDIVARLRFLVQAGLDYLTLNRPAASLSGGEAQRVALATQIGSGLAGVLYILDEPTIGLHQRDTARLLELLRQLRDRGNSLLVVEHDEETMLAADHVIEMGPGAGLAGGEVVAQGTPAELMGKSESLTGQYLSGQLRIEARPARRKGTGEFLIVKGARHNNLAGVDVAFPVGALTCVTGVSGSGKSSLVTDVLYNAVVRLVNNPEAIAIRCDALVGWEHFDRVVAVDQRPLGRTPRSNPATYTGLYDPLRELFAQLPEARVRGYSPARFSFNMPGGRCESCGGDGLVRVEMYFLPETFVRCDVCNGTRYNRETLEIKYKGINIAEVLDLTVTQALEIFGNIPAIAEKLRTLFEVGLGYLRLGQAAQTLSGGEAQRVKLAKELSRRSTGKSLYVLDEPSSGLHFADIQKLLDVLHRLTDAGNTVIVVEHNLDMIQTADFVVDMGPEAGDRGGRVIATGTPEEVAADRNSYTGRYLAQKLRFYG